MMYIHFRFMFRLVPPLVYTPFDRFHRALLNEVLEVLFEVPVES